MEPQSGPPPGKKLTNGVDHAALRRQGSFTPRNFSFLWRAKLELLVALGVIGGVFFVFIYLVQIPGALVVRALDDGKHPVVKAHVRCSHEGSGREMSGDTDIFGEAKFPGLEEGPWTCRVEAPARFFSPPLIGVGVVAPRHPATVQLFVERGADVEVTVVRPEGAPRASVNLRAVCEARGPEGATGWEARTGLLDGSAILHLPRSRTCRVGLLPGSSLVTYGLATALTLDCGALPCTAPLDGGVGEHLSAKLRPTLAQWEAARPAPVLDEADAGAADAGTVDGGR